MTHQKRLRAHNIRQDTRRHAAEYIDELEGYITEMHDAPTVLTTINALAKAMELIKQNHSQ